MKKIIIKKSEVADTRTCDWTKVSKEQLFEASKSHKKDVLNGAIFLCEMLRRAGEDHDKTKLSEIDWFYDDFKTGFERKGWWEMHQKEERHHFNNGEHIQDDVNLIDVLEQIIDGVMAGLARSGEYRKEMPSPELLMKAYENTAKLLIENVEVK